MISRLIGLPSVSLFNDVPELLRQFQVYQRENASIDLLVVPNFGSMDTELERIRQKILIMSVGEVTVSLVKGSRIEQWGGKLKFVISDYVNHN